MRIAHVKLGAGGRLVLPAALYRHAGLRPGDTLVVESDGDSLLVRGPDPARAEVSADFTDRADPPGLAPTT